MKKFTKKFALILMCIVCLTSILTGCTLVTTNKASEYSQVVATDNSGVSVTKEELLNTYSNYASTLISNNGYTKAQATEYCLNLLINRKILLQKAKAEVTLTQKEKNTALTDAYDYIITQIQTNEKDVRTEWDITDPNPSTSTDSTDSTSTSSSSTSKTYTEYSAKSELVSTTSNGVTTYSINRIDDSTEEVEEENYGHKNGFVKGFYAYWKKDDEAVANEAFDRYIKTLKENESYKNLSTATDDVLLREIQRVYDIDIDNAYLTRTETNFDKSENVTTQNMLDEYLLLRNEDIAKYDIVGGTTGTDAFVSDVLSSASDIYYVPQSMNNQFFYVSQVLLPFSTEQTADLTAEKTLLKQGNITQADYDAYRENLAKQIMVTLKDDSGNDTDTKLSASDVYKEIELAVNPKATLSEKAKAFNTYIYKYNTDSGIMNAEKDYVIGKKIDETTETRSKMVTEFTTAARDLETAGKLGAISSLVVSDYGYHILMFTGYVCDMNISTTNADQCCIDLNNYLVNAHSDKTYFNTIYDLTILSNYGDYEQGVVDEYKSQHKITVYPQRYSDMTSGT
jgi:hypothetical protein